MKCPACEGALATTAVGGLHIDLCDRCGGSWFDRGELESHLDGGAALPHVLASPPRRTPVWRRCPRCAQPMTPRNWEKHSGVVVDVCHAHGAWIDAGEVARLQAWFMSERRVRVQARQADEARAGRSIASFGTDTSARAETHASGGWFAPVLEVLAEIPWFFSD